MTLNEKQFQLGDLVFGRHTAIEITDFDPTGKPDVTNQDQANTGEDGVTFGRDYTAGRLLSFTGAIAGDTAADAWSAYEDLLTAWNAEGTRESPNSVLELQMRMPGCGAVSVFGRPRQCDPSPTGYVTQGVIPFTANFQCADMGFYSPVDETLTVTLLPNVGGGFTFPVTWPTSLVQAVVNQGVAQNVGSRKTWPVVRFNGPTSGSLINPEMQYPVLGLSLKLTTTILPGQWVEVDTRPWVRTILNSNGGSEAGGLVNDPMSAFALPKGGTLVAFRGQDSSGSSSMSFKWRSSSASPGANL